MKDKLVPKYNQILRSLLEGKSTVNKLYKKTGLKKNNEIMQIKEDLIKALLIIERKNKKEKNRDFHSQSHIIELSKFGRKVALFLKNSDEFDKHFKIYLDKVEDIGKYIAETEDDKLKPEIKKKLKREGWNNDDIENYFWRISDLNYFKIKVLDTIIEIIFNKYADFKINFNPNSMALEYLKKVIGEKIMHYIIYKMDISENIAYGREANFSDKEIDKKKLDYKNHKITLCYMDELVEIIEDVSNQGSVYRKNISNEIKKLLLCLIYLSEFERWKMGIQIDRIQWEIDHSESSDDEDKRDPREIDLYNELFPDPRPVKIRKKI